MAKSFLFRAAGAKNRTTHVATVISGDLEMTMNTIRRFNNMQAEDFRRDLRVWKKASTVGEEAIPIICPPLYSPLARVPSTSDSLTLMVVVSLTVVHVCCLANRSYAVWLISIDMKWLDTCAENSSSWSFGSLGTRHMIFEPSTIRYRSYKKLTYALSRTDSPAQSLLTKPPVVLGLESEGISSDMSTTSQPTMLLTLTSPLLTQIRRPLENPTAKSFQIILDVIVPKLQWIDFQNVVLRHLGSYFSAFNKSRATVRLKMLGSWLVAFDRRMIWQQNQINDVKDALKHLANTRTKLTSAPSMKQSEWQTDLAVYERDLRMLEVEMRRIVEEAYRLVDDTVHTPAVDKTAYKILKDTRPELLTPAILMSTYINLSPAQRRVIFVTAIGSWETCQRREAASPEFVDAHKMLVEVCTNFRAAEARYKATGDPNMKANVADEGTGIARVGQDVRDTAVADQAPNTAQTVEGTQDANMPNQDTGTAETVPNIHDTTTPEQLPDTAETVQGTQDTDMTDKDQDQKLENDAETDEDEDAIIDRAIRVEQDAQDARDCAAQLGE